MKKISRFGVVTLALSACSAEQGIGFDYYEVEPKQNGRTERVEVQWQVQKPIPRYRVNMAETAEAATSVQPYAQSPGASVAAVSVPGVWMRVVDDGSRVWLVAEAVLGGAPDIAGLRSEVIQRSGCLIGSAVSVGSATVFRLDCR